MTTTPGPLHQAKSPSRLQPLQLDEVEQALRGRQLPPALSSPAAAVPRPSPRTTGPTSHSHLPRLHLRTWKVGELNGVDPVDDPEDDSASAAARDADAEGNLVDVTTEAQRPRQGMTC